LAYANSHKSFPGWRNYVATPPAANAYRVASWITMLLQNMERQDLWQQVKDPTKGYPPLVPLRLLICPSDPPDSVTGAGPSAYVANGLVLRDQFLYNLYYTNKSNAAYSQFRDLAPQTLDFISGADGTTNTLMLGENTRALKAHNWYDFDVNTATTLPAPVATSFQFRQTFGCLLTAQTYPTGLLNFAKSYGAQIGYSTVNQMTANITSSHGGGSVVTFFDGHGQFLRDEVGLLLNGAPSTPATGSGSPGITVFQILVTPDGSKNLEPPADEGQWQ